jgi:putative transposase
MRAATLESRLEELGVLKIVLQACVSATTTRTQNHCSGRRNTGPTTQAVHSPVKEVACQWVASFVTWYNHRHRHSGIKFVTPVQRHSGDAVEIYRHRAVVYEQARQRHPRRWSRSTRCWRQPEVVWINPPPPAIDDKPGTLTMAA